MRAIGVFPKERSLRLVDHPEPSIELGDHVKVRILDVGVCGTDREIARFDYGASPPGSPYLVLGHESLGRVVEVGPGVKHLRPGDLVVSMVRRPCPHPACLACRSGRPDFCFTGDFKERGIKQLHGYMTEHIVEEERYMHKVPESLRSVGVLIEPLTIAEKALTQVWDVQQRLPWTAACARAGEAHGGRALVLGAGPVGMLGALALLVRGYETCVYSRNPEDSFKANWVRKVGARYVSSTTTTLSELAQELDRIDLIYEATGAASLSFRALETLGPNGVFIFTGVPGRKGPSSLDEGRLMRNLVLNNQLVFGTVNAGSEAFDAAIGDLARFAQRWPDPLKELITGRFAIDAYEKLLLEPREGIKNVLCFAQD